jgi:hypothetical protein
MTRNCGVPGCTSGVATEYGLYCTRHAANKRRHGHPEQHAVLKSDLKPYLASIRERRAKNDGKKLWGIMEARWSGIVSICDGILHDKMALYAPKREAAREIVKLGSHVEAQSVVDTVLAMYLLQYHDPRRFKSDDAFWTQLVRRVRGLTKLNRGSWKDAQSGKIKTAAKEVQPRTAEAMAYFIKEALGAAGVWIAKLEMKEREERERERQEFHQALEELV